MLPRTPVSAHILVCIIYVIHIPDTLYNSTFPVKNKKNIKYSTIRIAIKEVVYLRVGRSLGPLEPKKDNLRCLYLF